MAARQGQWDFVKLLITSGLTPDEQDWVCNRVLECGQSDCLVDLLHQGVSSALRERIIDCAIKAVASLSVEDGAGVYLKILEACQPTERELGNVIKRAFYDLSFLLIVKQLLRVFTNSRRLIKQIFPTIHVGTADVIFMHTVLWDDEPDLAFHLYVSQQMWENVVYIYGDSRLTTKVRRFALKQAIQKQAWMAVTEMTGRSVTSERDRRHAFLQAARSGEWRTALKISRQCARMNSSDKVFALKMWAALGLWECVEPVFETWGYRQQILLCILKESIEAGRLDVFRNICSQRGFDTAFICRTALEEGKKNFVLEFCLLMADEKTWKDASEFAVKQQMWDLVKYLLGKRNHQWTSMKHFWKMEGFRKCYWVPDDAQDLAELCEACLWGIKEKKYVWPTVAPELNSCCEKLLPLLSHLRFSYRITHVFETTQLLEYCLETSQVYLALVLSFLSHNEHNFQRILERLPRLYIISGALQAVFRNALFKQDWGKSAVLLQYLTREEARGVLDEFWWTLYHDFNGLRRKCREKGWFEWATLIGVWEYHWDYVHDVVQYCKDTDVLDEVVGTAAEENEWGIVSAHLSRCSQNYSLLCRILYFAVETGNSEFCELLIGKVNPLHAQSEGLSLLYAAVNSIGNKEAMVKLCIRAGLSTHPEQWDSSGKMSEFPVMFSALLSCPQVVHLLYRAGACSNGELHIYKNDKIIGINQRRHGYPDGLEHVNVMARTPRSLQDLCRQMVSHLIGCQPSRSERILSLEVPSLLHEYINFADILS